MHAIALVFAVSSLHLLLSECSNDGEVCAETKSHLVAGVPMEVLKDVGMAITTMPEDFKPHKQVKRVYDQRKAMVESGEGVDWGMAEALAFGTLLIEGA